MGNSKKNKGRYLAGDIIGLALCFIIFIIPFWFMVVNSMKERLEANKLSLALPSKFTFENFAEVLKTNDYQLLTAFKNSIILTVGAVICLIAVSSMAAYVIQRRHDKITSFANNLFMIGLMIPAAVLPTIWLMQFLHIYKTMPSMILLETALQTPFTVMLYRGFMSTIPVELEEAAYIDGATPWQTFSKIIFPLLKPITSTVIILDAVTIFNDFTNPLYFFPGTKNVTVQLTLYNFMGQFSSAYNLLFANVLLITIPMLIVFLIFNNKIVDGMVAGSVKG